VTGSSLDVAGDGTNGLWLASENNYDHNGLDVMLPGGEKPGRPWGGARLEWRVTTALAGWPEPGGR
jgi:hypothetical protein